MIEQSSCMIETSRSTHMKKGDVAAWREMS